MYLPYALTTENMSKGRKKLALSLTSTDTEFTDRTTGYSGHGGASLRKISTISSDGKHNDVLVYHYSFYCRCPDDIEIYGI
jgi:hypothetical protein